MCCAVRRAVDKSTGIRKRRGRKKGDGYNDDRARGGDDGEVDDRKWLAAVQLATTALAEADGDLARIGESQALQAALVATLNRARKASYTQLYQQVTADPTVAVDLINTSVWYFAHAPVTKLLGLPTATNAEKRLCLRIIDDVLVNVAPLQPIPTQSKAVQEWYQRTFTHRRDDDECYFFRGVKWSRTGERLTDKLRPPTLGQYNTVMANGRPTNDDTPICDGALLPWIPQLCELEVLEAWGRAHKLHLCGIAGHKSRHHFTDRGIQYDGIEDVVIRALDAQYRSTMRAPLSRGLVDRCGSVDPEPFTYVANESELGGSMSFAEQLVCLNKLKLSDAIVENVGLAIANDQREKALNYVACGHCNIDTLSVQHAVHDDGYNLVLVTSDITASRREQTYPCRVAFRVDDNGKACSWVVSPVSKCSCVVWECYCAHQLALLAFVAAIDVLAQRVVAKGTTTAPASAPPAAPAAPRNNKKTKRKKTLTRSPTSGHDTPRRSLARWTAQP